MKSEYFPPFTITPEIVRLVSKISEWVGGFSVHSKAFQTPMLRRGNRLRSIQASLAIENNSLSLEQVTAIVNGKRVLGLPREIQEVRNAFAVYEALEQFDPVSADDLLKAHKILMEGLVDGAGKYRAGGVGIMKGRDVVHIAPPADRVELLMDELLGWLKKSDAHPLVGSCVFHYEFEFIHPFADGNGRMGRLWQTLILSRWKPMLAYLPVESVIRDRQMDYYRVLAKSDSAGNSTEFIEFLLNAILTALKETIENDQVSDQVSDQVGTLLKFLRNKTLTAVELMSLIGLTHKPTFRKNYLRPALNSGLIEMTIPDKPNSRLQKYRVTAAGWRAKNS